jgi:hypothetical protein
LAGFSARAERENTEMTDGSWGDYVADAGTDPTALSDASDSMADGIAVTELGVDSTAGADMTEATSNVDEAAGWQQWADGNLADAASWQDQAAGDVQAANAWAEWGNADAAQEMMNSAENASGIADGVVGTASTDLDIGAGYMDTASSEISDVASDSGD